MRELTVAAIQMQMADDVSVNVATAERLVREAAARGARLVLIPELFEGLYFCTDQLAEHFDRARPLAGHPTIAHFSSLARELGVVLPVSFFERANNAAFKIRFRLAANRTDETADIDGIVVTGTPTN